MYRVVRVEIARTPTPRRGTRVAVLGGTRTTGGVLRRSHPGSHSRKSGRRVSGTLPSDFMISLGPSHCLLPVDGTCRWYAARARPIPLHTVPSTGATSTLSGMMRKPRCRALCSASLMHAEGPLRVIAPLLLKPTSQVYSVVVSEAGDAASSRPSRALQHHLRSSIFDRQAEEAALRAGRRARPDLAARRINAVENACTAVRGTAVRGLYCPISACCVCVSGTLRGTLHGRLQKPSSIALGDGRGRRRVFAC